MPAEPSIPPTHLALLSTSFCGKDSSRCVLMYRCGWTSKPSKRPRPSLGVPVSLLPTGRRSSCTPVSCCPKTVTSSGRRAAVKSLGSTFLALLIELAGLYEERGEEELELAVQALQRALAEEPTNEEAHVGLMRLYASSGRSGEALRQYGRLSEALSKELGAEPSASTRALSEEIAAGRFPALRTQPAGLPTEETAGGGVGTAQPASPEDQLRRSRAREVRAQA